LDSNILTQFQEFCFSYKPIVGLYIDTNTTNNITTIGSTSPSKMNYLRQKFGSLTINKQPSQTILQQQQKQHQN